eukprot:FR739260.1.p3 GENE.FR739260.1~~FR739260.1.p3  ORF type:complete len:108 (+),score=32.03 FR739260.1:682-1005(+)
MAKGRRLSEGSGINRQREKRETEESVLREIPLRVCNAHCNVSSLVASAWPAGKKKKKKKKKKAAALSDSPGPEDPLILRGPAPAGELPLLFPFSGGLIGPLWRKSGS